MSPSYAQDRTGLIAGLTAYFAWGLLPLLMHGVAGAGAAPFEIVGWRTLWAIPFALGLVAATGRAPLLRSLLSSPRDFGVLLVSSALIAVNWSVYVWLVDTGQVLAASLGYYVNPLLSMAAGAALFGERISLTGLLAMALATAGVALQTVALGAFPWLALVQALTFAAYGVVRKRAVADAQTGLLVECLVLSVPAALYVSWLAHTGAGRFGTGPAVTCWLMLTGPATVGPLYLFSIAARRLSFTTLGFIQFLAPTLIFACGLAEGEALTRLRALSFGFIWAGVAVFALGGRRGRGARAAQV